MTTENNVLISVKNLQKSFGSLNVLAGIDIDKAKDAINSAVNGDSVLNNDTLADRLKKLK